MQAQGGIRNTGNPSGDRGIDQLAARKAGLTGMAERLVVLMKRRVTPVEGRGFRRKGRQQIGST
jgi:hypothetical protein